jgi:hypothetical protein
VWDVKVGISARQPQASPQQRGGGNAVHIVIAINANAFSGTDSFLQSLSSFDSARQLVGFMQVA